MQYTTLSFELSDGTQGVIKVSQGENVATHIYTLNNDYNGADTGKDWLLAPFDCIVKAIRTYDNQILFANVEPVMTPSGAQEHVCFTPTHMDDVDFKQLGIVVGKRFKQGERIYREGTKGIGSGNHIHMSQAFGAFKGGTPTVKMGKTYTYNGKKYEQYKINADNEVSAYAAFFVGCPVVKGLSDTANAYKWHEVPKEGKMNFKDGYQKHLYNNQTIHTYKQSAKEKIALYSFPWGTVKDIADFQIKEINGKKVKVKAVLNCHYFAMNGDKGFLGRCQSLTNNGTTKGKGENGFVGYKGTQDKPYMDLVVLRDGTIKCGDFNSWEYLDAHIGVAPAGVQIQEGVDVDLYSPECGYGKITTANTQSVLLKDKDGKFVLVAVSGQLSPKQIRTWTKNYGVIHQSCYDSGRSTQMIVDGEKKVYTGRKIPTCFIIYEELEDVPERKYRYIYFRCTKATTPKGYPTRATVKSDTGFTDEYIKECEIIRVDDIDSMAGKSDGYCRINDITKLHKKWFAFDPDYFEGATEDEWLDYRGIDIE